MESSIPSPQPVPSHLERASAHIGQLARQALIDELETWPKPGLVSPRDSGSHRDMDARTLRRSADALAPFFVDLARAGAEGAPLLKLRRIGLAAEAAMLAATDGVNAHRGAIFSLGLICAAAGTAGDTPLSAGALAKHVGARWGREIADTPPSPASHGGRVVRRYGVGGAAAEAAAGFPTVRALGLPALRRGRIIASGDSQAARVECLFALMAELDDTNLLHRGGPEGLEFARASARDFLSAGGVGASNWRERALALHANFVSARLSPGGAADLLAVTVLLDSLGND